MRPRTRGVLTPAQAREIFGFKTARGLRRKGVSSEKLGVKYGVSSKTIRDIWRGRTWLETTSDLWESDDLHTLNKRKELMRNTSCAAREGRETLPALNNQGVRPLGVVVNQLPPISEHSNLHTFPMSDRQYQGLPPLRALTQQNFNSDIHCVMETFSVPAYSFQNAHWPEIWCQQLANRFYFPIHPT